MIKSFVLLPHELNSNIQQIVVDKTKEKFNNTVTKDDGYIYNIKDDVKIIANYVSPSVGSEIVFKVLFHADVLKPKIDDIFDGKVIIIDDRGIFTSVQDKMPVLIPSRRIDAYKYVKSENIFTDGKKIIANGDYVKLKIVAVRFDKKFDCIAILI